MASESSYTLNLKWSGKTDDPRTYDRSFLLSAEGREAIAGSAEPGSRGDATKWNPEELLLSSLASCNMLWYLYLCATAKIVVLEYEDQPTGKVGVNANGKRAFVEASLNPKIVISDPAQKEKALALLQEAHEKCFIVHSVNFEVKVNPQMSAA